MTVIGTYGTGRSYAAYSNTAVQPSSCYSANSNVATAVVAVSGCAVTLSRSGGASSVNITAIYNGLSASVSYRSYYLIQFSLNSTRTSLRRLGCDFEAAYLSAYAALTLDGMNAITVVDLSNIVTFTSSNPQIVSVSGRNAQGLALGSVSLSYGVSLLNVSVSVVNTVASVVQLVSYAYSGASVIPTTLSVTELSTSVVSVQPQLQLTAELQTAKLVTYAQDDDGVWTDVSRSPRLTLASINPADLNVSNTGTDWQLIVPVGASTVSGSMPIIQGTWTDSCRTVLTSSGYGFATSNLSVPIAIVVTATVSTLVRPGSPAATTLGIPSSTQLTVTVTYRSTTGGLSYKVFTTDKRTVYSTTFLAASGTLSSSALLALNSSVGAGTAGNATVVVTLPTYSAASGLSGVITISIVDVNSAIPLSGLLVHTMTPSVLITAATPLSQIACTGYYCKFLILLFVSESILLHLKQTNNSKICLQVFISKGSYLLFLSLLPMVRNAAVPLHCHPAIPQWQL